MGKMIIGKDTILDLLIMQRHIACFGASGSGKTVASKVIVEELVRQNIPVIAFDPQGDIASLVNPEEFNPNTGTPEFIYKEYAQNSEVLIFTPGSSKGIPLCINPLKFDEAKSMDSEDRLRFLSSVSKNIIGLIGYDLESDDGKTTESVLSLIFEYCIKSNINLDDFNQLIDIILDMPESINSAVETICSQKLIQQLTKKLKLLTLGSRQLIFNNGFSANIETLLGLDKPENGKTRVSVIYLNTLHTQQEKEFFVSAICQMLYSWMLKNPLKTGQDGLQCALYIDEIAPYLPPVKKPACKESLSLLLKQARKYGVGCLLATQNPGDVDYKSIAQVQSYLIGRLTTKQDLQKVKNRLDSIAPNQSEEICEKLPSLKKGNFILLAPDAFDKAIDVNIRWLVSNHSVLTEDQLKQYVPSEFLTCKDDDNDNDLDKQNETEENNTELVKQEKQEDTKESYFTLKMGLFESELAKKTKPMLESGVFSLKEEISEKKFKYLPLFLVNLTFYKKQGILFKKEKGFECNLLIEQNSKQIVYLDKKTLKLNPQDVLEPTKIKTLEYNDNDLELKEKQEFAKLNEEKNYKQICDILTKKFKVDCNSYKVIMLPVWEIVIKKRKGAGVRKIIFEAFSGKQVLF